MGLLDLPCEFVIDEELAVTCGSTPTMPVPLDRAASPFRDEDLDEAADVVVFGNFCEEHAPQVARRDPARCAGPRP